MKNNILNYLEKDKYISGEFLAKRLGISRVGIWKRIQKLKTLQYSIISHPNLGYCLISTPDLLLPDEIRRDLKTNYIGHEIYYYQEIESTNIIAKEMAQSKKKKIPEGTLVIAEEQSGGKGRLGRKWHSPAGGIWLSVILYPRLSPAYIPRITLVTAVALVRSIIELTQIQPLIKWPNDILIHGKKVCGILTEMSAELDMIKWLVIGVGINVNIHCDDFPVEIRDISISLEEILKRKISRVKLVKNFLRHLEADYQILQDNKSHLILEEWKKHSHTLGRRISVNVGNRIIHGKAVDINENGALIIEKNNGKQEEIITGTILNSSGEKEIL